MNWEITHESRAAYERAEEHDTPIMRAYDALWARISIDPANEGASLRGLAEAGDPAIGRVLRAMDGVSLPEGTATRVAYEPIEGPSKPPPWLAFAVFAPNWKTNAHLLVALGYIDRHGRRR